MKKLETKKETSSRGTRSTRASRIRGASSERRERQKQELRQLIINAASDLFLENGYENFSLRGVAERIGYSPTTIYLYFQNKDDLLLSAVRDGFEAFDRQVEAIARGAKNPLQRIEALGRNYIAFGMENPALYRLMFMQRSDFYVVPRTGDDSSEDVSTQVAPEIENYPSPHLEQPRTVSHGLLVNAVADAMDAGLLQPGEPILIADAMWAGVHGLVSLAISPLMSREHSEKVIDPLLHALIEGFRKHK